MPSIFDSVWNTYNNAKKKVQTGIQNWGKTAVQNTQAFIKKYPAPADYIGQRVIPAVSNYRPIAGRPTLGQAYVHAVKTTPTQLGNLYRGSTVQNYPAPLRTLSYMAGNTAQTIGTGVSDILQNVPRVFTQGRTNDITAVKKLVPLAKTAMGAARIIAPTSMLWQGANTIASYSPRRPYVSPLPEKSGVVQRFAKGYIKGVSGDVQGLAPNVKPGYTKLPIVGNVDIPEVAGSMIGFTKNPLWTKIFSKTKLITSAPETTKNAYLFVTSRLFKGGLEGFVQGLINMPDDLKGNEKANYMLQQVGFGAASELATDTVYEGGKKVVNMGKKAWADVYDEIIRQKRIIGIPANAEIDTKTGKRIQRTIGQQDFIAFVDKIKKILGNEEGYVRLGEEEPETKPQPQTGGGGGVPKIKTEVPKVEAPPEMEPPKTPPGTPPKDQDLITKITNALRKAGQARTEQQQIYSKEKGARFGKVMGIREDLGGEAGFYKEKAALEGQYTKADYEAIRNQFSQKEVDSLLNMVKKSKSLAEWDKVPAQQGVLDMLEGKIPQKNQIEKMYKVFGKDFTNELLDKRTFFQKLIEKGDQLYEVPRSMLAGVGDFSATLMQNLMNASRHPLITAKNFVKSVKDFADPNYYKSEMEGLVQRPNALEGRYKAGNLHITNLGPSMEGMEEGVPRLIPITEKIPVLNKVVQATSRAWTGFLNRQRADIFDYFVNSQKNLGENIDDVNFLRKAGESVNAGTGWGGLGAFERVGPYLSKIFFSARKLAATGYFLDPRSYTTAPKVVRQENLKTVGTFVGVGLSQLLLAKMAGAEIGTDPTSADFGKIKVGNTRWNVFGPYQQVAVLIARIAMGYKTSSTTGSRTALGDDTEWVKANRLDLIKDFFASKLHPSLTYMTGAISGKSGGGQPFNYTVEALDRLIPMFVSDSYDLMKEHGPGGLIGVIPATLGIPTQTYGKQYAKLETTPGGKPTMRLYQEPGLAEDFINKVTGKKKSNIPERAQETITSIREHQTKLEVFKDLLKQTPLSERKAYIMESVKNGSVTKEDLVKMLNKKSTGTPQQLSENFLKLQTPEAKFTYLKSLTKGKKKEEIVVILKNLIKSKVLTAQDLQLLGGTP